MKFILPTGIGDSVWALHKIKSVRDQHDPSGPIDIYLAGTDSEIETRALDFLRRFDFVNSVEMRDWGLLGDPVTTPDGYFNYVEDGMYEFKGEQVCALIPNAALERGIRLEDWLPNHQIDWDIFKHFDITYKERAAAERIASAGPYAVFYPGPLQGNTVNGHNRGMMWKPQEWIDLGRRIHNEFGLNIVVVGAPYDSSYYDLFISTALNGDGSYWNNQIGHTKLGELFSITNNAEFVISYQAGVGIVSTYLNTPTAIFWRPRGNSISPDRYISFEESMASAWVPPSILFQETHLPLIYGRHKVDDIMSEITQRGWA
jgi:hypothetical protein